MPTESEKEAQGKCGLECEVYSRVVGYYRPVQQWNKGKQAEFKRRRPYKVNVAAFAKAEKEAG